MCFYEIMLRKKGLKIIHTTLVKIRDSPFIKHVRKLLALSTAFSISVFTNHSMFIKATNFFYSLAVSKRRRDEFLSQNFAAIVPFQSSTGWWKMALTDPRAKRRRYFLYFRRKYDLGRKHSRKFGTCFPPTLHLSYLTLESPKPSPSQN